MHPTYILATRPRPHLRPVTPSRLSFQLPGQRGLHVESALPPQSCNPPLPELSGPRPLPGRTPSGARARTRSARPPGEGQRVPRPPAPAAGKCRRPARAGSPPAGTTPPSLPCTLCPPSAAAAGGRSGATLVPHAGGRVAVPHLPAIVTFLSPARSEQHNHETHLRGSPRPPCPPHLPP